MILWLKRGTAVASFIFIMPLAIGSGTLAVALLSALVNSAWVMSERFPPLVQRFLAPCVLIVNAVVSSHAALHDGPAAWAILTSGSSLVSWNAGLFRQRCPNASPSLEWRYLKRVGGIFALGTGMGMSALALQGQFPSPFWLAFFMMVAAGFLCLRLISQASLQGREEK